MKDREISALEPGDRLFEYRIEKVIAQGGFGITYLGVQTETGARVVIKENIPGTHAFRRRGEKGFSWSADAPTSGAGSRQWARENFIREARSLAKLHHPNVVSVLNAYESDVTHTEYYVMPYVESVSLEQAMDRGLRPTHDWAHYMLCTLLHALAYVHGAGFLHRDIKPSNILVQADGSPVLIDFGSARGMERDEKTRIVSEEYSPIEQTRGTGEGPWTDLYSLGATFYRILSGRYVAGLMQRMDDPQSYTPLVSDEQLIGRYGYPLLSSIDHALAFEPEERYRSADEWMNALVNVPGFQAVEPVPLLMVAPRNTSSSKTVLLTGEEDETKTNKKKIWPWIIFPILLIMIALLLAFFLFQGGTDEIPLAAPVAAPQLGGEGGTGEGGTGEDEESQSETVKVEQQLRVIIRPKAKLYTEDGNEVVEDPDPFSTFYVVEEKEDRYLVARQAGKEVKAVGSLKKDEVYPWRTNLMMVFNAQRAEDHAKNAGALTSDNRALFFSDQEKLEQFVKATPQERRNVAKKVEEQISKSKTASSSIDLGDIGKEYGIIGVEPKRRGEYRLPLLSFPQGQITYGEEIDQQSGGSVEGGFGGATTNPSESIVTDTSLVEVAAMNAPKLVDVDPYAIKIKEEQEPPQEPEPDYDIIFVVDTSRSMQPHIDNALEVMKQLAGQIDKVLGNKVRFAVIGYRDWKALTTEGTGLDEKFLKSIGYLVHNYTMSDVGGRSEMTRTTPGSVLQMYTRDDFEKVLACVKQTETDSIDYCEDVFAGLEVALRCGTQWVGEQNRDTSNHVRRIILIGDAAGRGRTKEGDEVAGGVPVIDKGREVNDLNLGSRYWAYRAKGTHAHTKYDDLMGYKKRNNIHLTSIYIYPLPKKDRLSNKDYVKTFKAYQQVGRRQFKGMADNNSFFELDSKNIQDKEAAARAAMEIAANYGESLEPARNAVKEITENDENVNSLLNSLKEMEAGETETSTLTEFRKQMEPISDYFLKLLPVHDQLVNVSQLRMMSAAVECALYERDFWDKIWEHEYEEESKEKNSQIREENKRKFRAKLAKKMSEAIVQNLRAKDEKISDEEMAMMKEVIATTFSSSLTSAIVEGIGLDDIMLIKSKTPEQRKEWLEEKMADDAYDVFHGAYVEWDASQSGEEVMDAKAWMPDRAEPRRVNLKPCVMLSRKQIEDLAENIKAKIEEIEKGVDAKSAMNNVAALFSDTLIDPGQRVEQQQNRSTEELSDRLKQLSYGTTIMNKVREVADSGEDREEIKEELEKILQFLRDLPSSYRQKSGKTEQMDATDAEHDYMIIPLDDM